MLIGVLLPGLHLPGREAGARPFFRSSSGSSIRKGVATLGGPAPGSSAALTFTGRPSHVARALLLHLQGTSGTGAALRTQKE